MRPRDEFIKELGSERLLQLMQAVDTSASQSDGPHFVDDDQLLDRWSASELTPAEHSEIISHLARCRECSLIVQEMIDAEAFVLPAQVRDVDEETARLDASWATASNQSSRRNRLRVLMSIAACVFVAAFGFFATRGSGTLDPDLLLAQADHAQLTHYLTESEFGSIAAGVKGTGSVFVPSNADLDRRLEDAKAEIGRKSADRVARLNFGQLLLEDGRLDEALDEFEVVLARDADNVPAKLGQAMVWFRQQKVAAAERVFASLESDESIGAAAGLNRVICLLTLDRKEDAAAIWKTLPPSARPERIRRILRAGKE